MKLFELPNFKDCPPSVQTVLWGFWCLGLGSVLGSFVLLVWYLIRSWRAQGMETISLGVTAFLALVFVLTFCAFVLRR